MSKNKHIDLKDIKDNIDIDNFDDNIISNDSTELSVLEDSSNMIELSIKDSISLSNNSKGKEKITSAIQEYMYRKYDDIEQIVARDQNQIYFFNLDLFNY